MHSHIWIFFYVSLKAISKLYWPDLFNVDLVPYFIWMCVWADVFVRLISITENFFVSLGRCLFKRTYATRKTKGGRQRAKKTEKTFLMISLVLHLFGNARGEFLNVRQMEKFGK